MPEDGPAAAHGSTHTVSLPRPPARSERLRALPAEPGGEQDNCSDSHASGQENPPLDRIAPQNANPTVL